MARDHLFVEVDGRLSNIKSAFGLECLRLRDSEIFWVTISDWDLKCHRKTRPDEIFVVCRA